MSPSHHLHLFSRLICCWLALADLELAPAQCNNEWRQGDGMPGLNAQVEASCLWDPDGTGPQASVLVVAGRFSVAGDIVASRIAQFDFATMTWSPLGAGMPELQAYVLDLAVLPSGELVACGNFTTAGTQPAAYIAAWNGMSWSPLGTGLSGTASALAVMPNGDLIAGGRFSSAGGVAAGKIARWDGVAWSPFGAGLGGLPFVTEVRALNVTANGDLLVGGLFTSIDGVPANSIARWNGSTWSAMGSGTPNVVIALTTTANGDVIAGGGFFGMGGTTADYLARWDGSSWSPVGSNANSSIWHLNRAPNGDIIVGGAFSDIGGITANGLASWNGTTWSAFGSGLGTGAATIAHTTTLLANGSIAVGGRFEAAGGVYATNLAMWDGVAFQAWNTQAGSGLWGPNTAVHALASLPGGDLIAGGSFTEADGQPVNRIARWDGSSWSPLGSGVDNTVTALLVMPNGDLIAGGSFSNAGGVAVAGTARWDGVTWTPFGPVATGTPTPTIYSLAMLPNGDVVAGGWFTSIAGIPAMNIASTDGTTWTSLGLGLNSPVHALAVLSDGTLFAGGSFIATGTSPINRVAQWNGTTWQGLGQGTNNTVLSLLAMPNGDLFAAGDFGIAGGVSARVARWDGATWSSVGYGLSGDIPALLRLPNGDVVAARDSATPPAFWRWSGGSWMPIGAGIDGPVYALCQLVNGDLVVAGNFTSTGTSAAVDVAILTTTCPATVIPFGIACVGSAGANTLSSSSLPWTGSSCDAIANGLPANSLALGLWSFSTASIPLATLLPQGQPGCLLQVGAEYVEVLLTGTGTVTTTLTVPNTASLAGLQIHHQVVAVEIDSSGSIAAVTSSNGLTQTIGTF